MKRTNLVFLASMLGCGGKDFDESEISSWLVSPFGEDHACSTAPECDFGYNFDLGNLPKPFDTRSNVVVPSDPSYHEVLAAEAIGLALRGSAGYLHDDEVRNVWVGNLVLVGTYGNNRLIRQVLEYAPQCTESGAVMYGVKWRNGFSTLVLVGDDVKELSALAKTYERFPDLPILKGRKSVTLTELLCSAAGAY